MNVIIQAAAFARSAHSGQVRKYTGTPYIFHPARVAGRVTLLPDATEQMVCAAWLHDVIEDCGVTSQAIVGEMGRIGIGVAALVMELTNTSKADFPNSNRAYRKEADAQRLHGASREAHNIKAIDRIDNIHEMGDAPMDFYELYMRESSVLLSAIWRADSELRDELRDTIQEAAESSKG